MKYHLITPFSRGQNMQKMVDHLSKFDVIWHPVIDTPFEFPKLDWIQPYTFIKEGYKMPCHQAWDKFLHSGLLIDEDYYQQLSDDDFLEDNFYEKIKGVDTDIIIVSMKRGDNVTTTSPYETTTLFADPNNMRMCAISGEQYLVKGKILKHEGLGYHPFADGVLAEKLWREQPRSSFTFVPDAFVLFNYLEPGRWNANK